MLGSVTDFLLPHSQEQLRKMSDRRLIFLAVAYSFQHSSWSLSLTRRMVISYEDKYFGFVCLINQNKTQLSCVNLLTLYETQNSVFLDVKLEWLGC